MPRKEQTTESLIRKIAEEPPIGKNDWNWFVILALIFAIVIVFYFLSLYPVTSRFIHIPTLFPDFLWISLIGLYSFWILYQLRFPEESFTKSARFPLLLAFFWILYSVGLFAWDLIADNEIHTHIGKCWIILFLTSIPFAGFGIFILKKGKPGNPVLTAAILFVFSLALANFCLKFVCVDQSSFHILVSHVSASLGLFLLGFSVFNNILKW
ncbi:NrsF family protein [Leptospira alstonii]|uniref:PF06532 family protein n=2 Tax=Leptospira alstonii TaxID=28452 RepID=M6DBX7_9LEPT|nr:NrsF family protein [Leptospira alstonii]EMJ96040.1 PF06532 family protein [Leptospira alstonii serovar Sichuan str. 79601]EQA79772.1 PF06532 family protein [Leptospira alstonii serovar Pingchang str. 80-412]